MRKYLLTTSLLALISGSIIADNVSVGTVELVPGKSQQISISLNNEKQYAAFQFDVVLPEGVWVSSGDLDGLAVSLTDRKDNHLLCAAKIADNTYRFLAYSSNNATFSGKEGALVNLSLSASDKLKSGELTAKIQSPVFVEADAAVADIDELSFPIKVAATIVGKVTTVAEKNGSGRYFAKLCPTTDVAINPEDAKVFSFYLSDGIAYFMSLRTQNGKYVVKAGDHVVIYTKEAKEISLESISDMPSSVGYDDVFTLDADKPLEEFKEEKGLTENDYIYRLTNTAAYGFAFTYYNGKVMKSGQFFIITPLKPTSSGRLETVWLDEDGSEIEMGDATAIQNVRMVTNSDVIYNLAGQKVDASYKGIVIKKGKKLLQK
jgi:hypothetical protein